MPARVTVASINGGGYRSRVRADRNTLVESHLYLVPPIAAWVHLRLPPSFELADLEGEGYVGLIRAATRYRPQMHNRTPFSAFARKRIHGAMVDSVRRRAWVENTRNPLKDAPEQTTVRTMPFLVRGPQLAAGPKRRGLGSPTAFRASHLPERLVRALRELTARQRAILGAFYSDGGSLVEIAAELHLSTEQVVAEHRAALDILHKSLTRNLSLNGLDRIYFEPAERAA